MKNTDFYNADPNFDFDISHRQYQQSFSYDSLNRLTNADYSYGSGTSSSFFDVSGITYDKAGNIESL